MTSSLLVWAPGGPGAILSHSLLDPSTCPAGSDRLLSVMWVKSVSIPPWGEFTPEATAAGFCFREVSNSCSQSAPLENCARAVSRAAFSLAGAPAGRALCKVCQSRRTASGVCLWSLVCTFRGASQEGSVSRGEFSADGAGAGAMQRHRQDAKPAPGPGTVSRLPQATAWSV